MGCEILPVAQLDLCVQPLLDIQLWHSGDHAYSNGYDDVYCGSNHHDYLQHDSDDHIYPMDHDAYNDSDDHVHAIYHDDIYYNSDDNVHPMDHDANNGSDDHTYPMDHGDICANCGHCHRVFLLIRHHNKCHDSLQNTDLQYNKNNESPDYSDKNFHSICYNSN
jgi:hypothetical protein